MSTTKQPSSVACIRLVRRCDGCLHFGELKGISGRVINTVCLAPVTTEPPPNGVTEAKHRFVYLTTANGECELHTPNASDQTREPKTSI